MTRLFLIDDHTLMREGLKSLLEGNGYEVVGEADSVTPGVAGVARLLPDIVLLDLSLGDRSGLDVLEEISRRKLPVKVVMLTMSDQPRHVAEAMRLGAYGYVLKGAPSSHLLETIDNVAQGRRHLAGHEAELAIQGLTQEKPVGFNDLPHRQRQVFVQVAKGRTSAQIADELKLSPKTIDSYRSRMMATLGLPDVASIVRYALQHKLID